MEYQDTHIEHLEAVNRNLRESCEILKKLDAEKIEEIARLEASLGAREEYIAELEADSLVVEKERQRLFWENETLSARIAELEAQCPCLYIETASKLISDQKERIAELEADRDWWRGEANRMGIQWQQARARIAELEARL